MPVFTVEVGTFTRRGDLQVYHRKVVDAYGAEEKQVREHYVGVYEGFSVRVTPVEALEIFVATEKSAPCPTLVERDIGVIKQIVYRAGSDSLFHDLYTEACKRREDYRIAEQNLIKTVRGYITNLPWCGGIDGDIDVDYSLYTCTPITVRDVKTRYPIIVKSLKDEPCVDGSNIKILPC
jgi:hypothetical protein